MKYLITSLMIVIGSSASAFHAILGSNYGWEDHQVTTTWSAQRREFADEPSYTSESTRLGIRIVRNDSIPGNNNKYHIEINAPINHKLADHLANILPQLNQKNRYATVVYLNSPGGSGSAGLRIGKMFRQYSVQAIVTNQQTCASACADMFIGAKYRSIYHTGTVETHAPYRENANGTITCVKEYADTARPYRHFALQMLGHEKGLRYFKDSFRVCSRIYLKVYSSNTKWIQSK